ncbi:hypothetical protein P153DRAFT_435751 [Dothidotthia symphoricarpi CBS 119687]|uniref:ubiquitinyl hydrolase 1 n=1 Tax=Dothidotthia symphoricarpi CBS 119687 TaxID=1392245 RepID=A0A6A5ZZ28_9PLEO|nr:uncharacterized protein P153DRAFT_435751 [Dothidotthia symphoricarpi CBS 119687]KAF2123668.1 hypothetical protein P153DRAFT_435751 [Dothidotthia symphoricarpi CBS 119687]
MNSLNIFEKQDLLEVISARPGKGSHVKRISPRQAPTCCGYSPTTIFSFSPLALLATDRSINAMATLAHVFNHLVLPPQIPGEQDEDIERSSHDILVRLIRATSTLARLAGQNQTATWQPLRQSLRRCQSLHERGHLEKQSLISEFKNIQHDQPLVLHIIEQNAALIVRRDISENNDIVIFEAFEASPPSAEVLAAEGALIWDFPDCAAQIPFSEFQKASFQDALADFLEKGSMEPLKRFQAHTTKAQTSVVESRDTASPALVTHLLIPLLEVIGSAVDSNVPQLRKRVRDDANIKAAEFPWRRLPFWLVLRVSTQRQLQLSLGNEAGRACYKFLVTTLLAELLNECPTQLAPELTITLRSKVCRRLAKLEQEKVDSPALYKHMFAVAGPFFKESIARVTKVIESAWEKFKRETTRPIPTLPLRADQQALCLSLPNSGAYLHDVLNLPRAHKKVKLSLAFPRSVDSTIEQVEQFTDMYFKLTKLEKDIETHQIPQFTTSSTLPSRCLKLAETISDLMGTVGTAYESNPEQHSILILNLFTLWVRLDRYMIEACPLLLKYRPVFSPELLDALHLPLMSEMQRLHDIQVYLQDRHTRSKHQTTILSEPDKHSFAVEYVAQSRPMKQLLEQIQEASRLSREAKKAELDRWCQEYDAHSLGISGGTCVCTFNRDGSRYVRGCDKCWHWRARNRMQIYAHEDFLPKNTVKAAAVVFELRIPASLAAYRNATWKIFELAYPAKPASRSPIKVLKDYEPFQPYIQEFASGITISSTSKPFAGTHYKVAKERMKASEADVLYPNGLTFFYFDMASDTWVKDFNKPLTFQHLCGVHVPRSLVHSVMPESIHPPTEVHGLSSYEVVASETECPPDIAIREFMAYQRLLSGKTRRWLTMLVELGASDVNFSNESTMHMFNHLTTQAGPSRNESGVLRDVHVVFKETSFCRRLAEQISNRLRSITSSWREVHCMEVLITLSLRLFTFASSKMLAMTLLKEARDITLTWITCLRDDVRSAREAHAAETAARSAFWAALLCRRTFSTFAESDQLIPQDDLSAFVQASMALQENLLVDLAKLPPVLKAMLIRDTKLAFNIQSQLLQSIKASPQSIGMAINASWSNSANSTRKVFTVWQTLTSPHDRWIVSTMVATMESSAKSQVVHYNFIEGHLLVDGKPLGKLPRDIRESLEVKKLFGNQYLRTLPSAEHGMSYVMTTRMHNHEFHFGMRDGRVIIRARTRGNLLEYVPPALFSGPNSFDLPFGLVSNCQHWLNLNMKCIEVRRKPEAWQTRTNDWIIDLVDRQGKRSERSTLVDPNSILFQQVADIFRHFENPNKITIFQPIHKNGALSVELRHLELSFKVNKQGLLQCHELGAEIDPNQDAGTLYGFESKIVLRDIADPKSRSIIAPWGELSSKRRGMHIAVRAASCTEYARFGIDEVLGRLLCPSEPRLLYAKAQFHAFTSFAIADPLTGRTGTEEALHILQSGCCQPWLPLGGSPLKILESVGKLSPAREYYPKEKKNLQNIGWKASLTMTIQHDAYEGLVHDILNKSEVLSVFAPDHPGHSNNVRLSNYTPTHLRKRGITQRRLYERNLFDTHEIAKDKVYNSRAQQANSAQARKVHDVAKLLCTQPFNVHITRQLSTVLEDWKLIGGFHATSEFMPASLSDLTEKPVDEQWGSLVNLCRSSASHDLYGLMFRLSLMSLNAETDLNVINVLAAFAVIPGLKSLQPPSYSSFNQFELNQTPTAQSLFRIISVDLPNRLNSTGDKVQKAHQKSCEIEGRRLAQHFLSQWPHEEPFLDGFESDIIDTGLATDRVVSEWHRLRANLKLSEYVMQIQDVLELYKGPRNTSAPNVWNFAPSPIRPLVRGPVIPSISRDLVVKSLISPLNTHACDEMVPGSQSATLSASRSASQPPSREMAELRKILSSFIFSSNSIRQEYARDLETSLLALEETSNHLEAPYDAPNITVIAGSIQKICALRSAHFIQIRNALSIDDDRFHWLDLGNLWPLNTSIEMLEQLRSSSNHIFGHLVKDAIVSHGILLTTLQKLTRLKHALYHAKQTRVQEELGNVGHENWDPSEFPDWLLLEIDSDLLIRQEQIDVARAIIAPKSGDNTVLQLNMGKGKTSCIVPMAMAILGNGNQLARLIVPKPLLPPTAQMIQSRLGGLVGRELRHIPFSRRTMPSPEILQLYSDLHQDMLRRCGVMLSAPEHVLSYKLSGLQHLAGPSSSIACRMIKFQSWLESTCRDVLDESDVSLAVKTQLIYPSGEQTTVDGHPHRWQVAQSLLSLVKDHLPEIRRTFPRSIEIIKRDHGYPMVYFLRSDAEEDLHRRIIDEISTGQTAFLRFSDSTPPGYYAEIGKVFTDTTLDDNLFRRVTALFSDENVASKKLLLVRGLLMNRILLLCLKKRWNVQYGLHPGRDPIAVPFEAKGVPSEQAEFGHPDAAILFTCLAFYYSGLDRHQLNQGLRHILASSDPSSEYDRWTSTCDTLPEALSHWNIINVDDQRQFEELWNHLRVSTSVLDHYMNHFVFPAHAKQFSIKLQASGWDLPLFSKSDSSDNVTTGAMTTGFSGTNDNKMMLPLTIRQDDLPSLHQTNAEVLTYLLQTRNRSYYLAAQGGKRLSETQLLNQLSMKDIRVLIDAGAYILEMDNEALVTAWLAIDTQRPAAVFFGADNRAKVRYRGMKDSVPLLATPFADSLDGCLVYFDQAHTRGVDLKLPQNAHGALTLAPGQTKDHTVQAAMRLRQLATTQSLSFFAFPETHQSILDVCKMTDKDPINSSHVVRWLLEQTCCANEQLQNLYISQGADFCNRKMAEWENAEFLSNVKDRDAYIKALQHPEHQTLEQLYGSRASDANCLPPPQTLFPQIQAFTDELNNRRHSTAVNPNAMHSFALEEVEQEREVEFQVEEVREVQQPVHYEALTFPGVHPSISDFVHTGILGGGEGYEHVFTAVSRTSVGQRFSVAESESRLFVSAEFMRTIVTEKNGAMDNFLRPVEWILYSPSTSTALILIAEEAELLIPELRDQEAPAKVHLLTYSAPITKKMLHFSALTYYAMPVLPDGHAIPHWLTIELGVFAGRLYMDFEEYARLERYVKSNGDGKRSGASAMKEASFLLEWLSLRRKGQDIMHTPAGYVCQGRVLDCGHAFFVKQRVYDKGVLNPYRVNEIVDSVDAEEVDEDDVWHGSGGDELE